MEHTLETIARDRIRLLPGLLADRFALNRDYVMGLRSRNLLQNHYLEAGIGANKGKPFDGHLGWESPACQVRGHFLGHWLSAAARIWTATQDGRVKAKADHIVAELGRCQQENGGEWVGSIPSTYLDWIARGKPVWAIHYTLHKTLMGLLEMARLTGNEQALDIAVRWAGWFHRWTGQFNREQMDDILDVETGGMLEAWADLYALTQREEHLELVRRYDRPRLFEPLLAGDDVLTNMHANTTIPEAHGAARAWEVTGERRWRDIVDAYWRSAVTDRGFFCTGGQTHGEVWTPPGELSARLGIRNQEHCTVYDMMRLAEYLLRWTGDPVYADYWERNLMNGILAQQHPHTGMVAYFLALRSGVSKTDQRGWGTPTESFWCCHGTLAQAHASHGSNVWYEDADGLVLAQIVPTRLTWEREGTPVSVTLQLDAQTDQPRRPACLAFDITVVCERPVSFALRLRMPWWLAGTATVMVNGEAQEITTSPGRFSEIHRAWRDDRVHVELPRALRACPLPDRPESVAFLDGPVVLAGLCDEERTLYGDPARPESMLVPDGEREWAAWKPGYRTVGQDRGMRFIPLHDVVDEPFAVYFPSAHPFGHRLPILKTVDRTGSAFHMMNQKIVKRTSR